MAVDLKDVTMQQLMSALPHLVKSDFEGEFVYDLELTDPDGVRAVTDKYWVKITPGKVEFGEGFSGNPAAAALTINQGGVDMVITFQVFGLEGATTAMIMGYIFTDNIKKAEAWFKILNVGMEPLKAALAKTGIELGSTDLDIFEELDLN